MRYRRVALSAENGYSIGCCDLSLRNGHGSGFSLGRTTPPFESGWACGYSICVSVRGSRPRHHPVPPTRAGGQDAVVPHLVRPRRGHQGSQSLKQLMALHQDVGRTIAPPGLEPIGEAAVRQSFESFECQGLSQHVAGESFQTLAVSGGNRNVRVETHASVAHAAGLGLSACTCALFPGIQRLDAIAEPSPGLGSVRPCGDAGTNRGGHQGGEKWIVAGQRVVSDFDTAFSEQLHDAPRRPRHDPADVLRLRGRQGEEAAGGMGRTRVDAIEH